MEGGSTVGVDIGVLWIGVDPAVFAGVGGITWGDGFLSGLLEIKEVEVAVESGEGLFLPAVVEGVLVDELLEVETCCAEDIVTTLDSFWATAVDGLYCPLNSRSAASSALYPACERQADRSFSAKLEGTKARSIAIFSNEFAPDEDLSFPLELRLAILKKNLPELIG